MTLETVMDRLEDLGTEQTKRIFMNHGATEPLFGVKIGDMKVLLKEIKKDHDLGLELFDTGNYDACYLSQYLVKPKKMTKESLDAWLEQAHGYMIVEYVVARVTAESDYAMDCIKEWITHENPKYRSAGYAAYASYISIKKDEELDLDHIYKTMENVTKCIHDEEDRVKYTMNNFIICAGSYISSLTDTALMQSEAIGKVSVYMGKTSCKVPSIHESILKVQQKNRIGKKRKRAIC